jgi:hypothetical protein
MSKRRKIHVGQPYKISEEQYQTVFNGGKTALDRILSKTFTSFRPVLGHKKTITQRLREEEEQLDEILMSDICAASNGRNQYTTATQPIM